MSRIDNYGVFYCARKRTTRAALRTGILKKCLHAACLEYHWNGKDIDAVFEVDQLA